MTAFEKEVAKQRYRRKKTGFDFLVVGDQNGNVLKGKKREKALLAMGCTITKVKIDR